MKAGPRLRGFQAMILLLCLAGLLSACRKDPGDIYLGFNTWVGYQAMALAAEREFFKAEGLSVRVKSFATLSDSQAAFESKKIDVMLSTSMEVLSLRAQGHGIKMIWLTDYSNGADSLVARAGIRDLRGLRGKRIGVEIGSISHYVLARALESAQLAESDVQIINQTVEESAFSFANGRIDAMATWDPHTTNAVKQHGARVLFDSSKIPGEIPGVLSVRESLLTESPEACKSLVIAYIKTLRHIQENRAESEEFLARSFGSSVEEFQAARAGVSIMDLAQNVEAVGVGGEDAILYRATDSLSDFLYENKMISTRVDATEAIEPGIIRALQASDL